MRGEASTKEPFNLSNRPLATKPLSGRDSFFLCSPPKTHFTTTLQDLIAFLNLGLAESSTKSAIIFVLCDNIFLRRSSNENQYFPVCPPPPCCSGYTYTSPYALTFPVMLHIILREKERVGEQTRRKTFMVVLPNVQEHVTLQLCLNSDKRILFKIDETLGVM